jgi:PPOX class probable F420-dependent enzyme
MDRDDVLAFLREREHAILATTRSDGRPQMSPVVAGVDPEGRVVVSTYAARDKARNVKRDPRVSVCFMSDDFDGPWIQVDGRGEVVDGEEGVEALVGYYRALRGEHPDWDTYRDKMREGDKVLIRVTLERSSPVSQGGPYEPKGAGWAI